MTPADLKAWRSEQTEVLEAMVGINQAELARRLGVHEITVSRWERGQTPIPPFLHLALWAIEHNAPKP